MDWKDRPLGIKIIIIILSINIVLQFYTLTSKLQKPNMIFGMFIDSPVSIIITLLLFVIPIIVLYGIYKQKLWKLILALRVVSKIRY